MPQPITSDEGDANLAWNAQTGTSMPSTYLATTLNSVNVAQGPVADNMAEINVDIDTTAEMKAYYRQVVWND